MTNRARVGRFFLGMTLLVAVGLALFPLLDWMWARLRAERLIRQVDVLLSTSPPDPASFSTAARLSPSADCAARVALLEPVLSTWGNIGGCGVSGSATAGSVKWVGRGVTGGLVDVQCLLTQSGTGDGTLFTTLNTRVGAALGYKWLVGASIPFQYKRGDVDASGMTRTASLAGWGDLSLEVTRKLGISNATSLTLSLSAPTGAHDAIRQGIELPQRLQLGSGTIGGALLFEHTRDHDWGLSIYGAALQYGGPENSLGDQRASAASAYAHAGYIKGPFVAALGLSLTSKLMGDRERGARILDQPMVLASPSVSLEWSTDWLALLLAASSPLSLSGLESWMVGLGLQASLF